MLRTTIIAALLAVSGTAAAEDTEGFLFGIGAGQVDYDTGFDIDDRATAWKAFIGYRFNPNFTAEVAYIDGGVIDGEVGGVHITGEATAVQTSLTGGWWFTDAAGAYVRGGWTNYDVAVKASALGRSVTVADEQDAFGYGVGLQAWWDRALWRLEYEASDVDGSNVQFVSLNIGWQF